MSVYIYCRNCRKPLINDLSYICTAHGNHVNAPNSSDCNQDAWFIVEHQLNAIEWIRKQLNASNWTKGKIVCPYSCGHKLGSYNFVRGAKCDCNQHLLPSVHLVRSRVDYQSNEETIASDLTSQVQSSLETH